MTSTLPAHRALQACGILCATLADPTTLSTWRLLCHTKKMYLSFQNKSFWESLHLKNGLEDWDMAEELKLAITTEEFLQGKGLRGID